MNVPYTTKTGLKIGSRYAETQLKPMVIEDADMLLIQKALIYSPRLVKAEKTESLLVVVSFICFVSIIGAIFFMVK